jgi:hypothetical protein
LPRAVTNHLLRTNGEKCAGFGEIVIGPVFPGNEETPESVLDTLRKSELVKDTKPSLDNRLDTTTSTTMPRTTPANDPKRTLMIKCKVCQRYVRVCVEIYLILTLIAR